jgi:predicted Rossmann fold nucleotide-binding protein DprA/Smf involved in DNA uptake
MDVCRSGGFTKTRQIGASVPVCHPFYSDEQLVAMKLGENAEAIILLSAQLSSQRRNDPSPLTPIEYGKLSIWLHRHHFEPKDLIRRAADIRNAWEDLGARITLDRVEYLMGRSMALAVALEKWNSAGIWILTRADSRYPERLHRRLGNNRPPVLFGVGNQSLLDKGGLAIVGSRNVDNEDLAYTERVAGCASASGMNVVSGGAKGVDEAAMQAALAAEGTALGILGNSLLQAALSGKWRPFVKRGELCLVSPFYPEAGFNVGNAMARNKYIYCTADYALVVRSDRDKGGTWAGATEALKKDYAPVFVKTPSEAAGNRALLDIGAFGLIAPAEQSASPDWLAEGLRKAVADSSTATPEMQPTIVEPEQAVAETVEQIVPAMPSPISAGTPKTASAADTPAENSKSAFFDFFVAQTVRLLETKPEITLSGLKERHPDLSPKQVTEWLKRAVDEGHLIRPGRAHSYRLKSSAGVQPSLFDAEGQ